MEQDLRKSEATPLDFPNKYFKKFDNTKIHFKYFEFTGHNK